MGKLNYKWPCSIANLNYQSVCLLIYNPHPTIDRYIYIHHKSNGSLSCKGNLLLSARAPICRENRKGVPACFLGKIHMLLILIDLREQHVLGCISAWQLVPTPEGPGDSGMWPPILVGM